MDQIFVDVLRGAHLTCFAAGMGTALYHDFKTVQGINNPITAHDIKLVERLHDWIMWAFMGLWVTGVVLIYVRTSFDLAAFTPKLWLKISLMVLLALNARMIGLIVLPILKRNIGRPIIEMPARDLALSSQVAITSMFCWTAGLSLGASAYLKIAPWSVLLPLAGGWFVLCTLGGQLMVNWARARAKATSEVQLELAFEAR